MPAYAKQKPSWDDVLPAAGYDILSCFLFP